MKTIICCFAAMLLAGSLHAQSEEKISAAQWQEDLRFLQKTVHEDYSFLFRKTTANKFDERVEELFAAIPEMQQHEIVAGLARIVSSFEYGHTAVGVRNSRFRFHQLPANLYWFSDGIYIEGTRTEHAEALGAKVLEVEGMPVDKVLAAVRPVVPAENDQFLKGYGLQYLGVPEVLHAQGVIPELSTKITLTLQRDGKTFPYEFECVSQRHFPVQYGFSKHTERWKSVRNPAETPLYLDQLDRKYFDEYLPEHKTLYIRHSEIQDDSQENIPEFYERVFRFIEDNDVERLVLDLRLNGGGNNYKNKPIVTGIIETRKINQPGKLFVIIGRRTFSACQNLVNELDNYTNAIFVGEPSAENVNFYGDNRTVHLPHSRLPVFLSFAWWQDKPQWENADWAAPQLAVELGFDDYRNNRDPVLQAALEFSDDDFVLDPAAHLARLFESGQLDQLKQDARRLVTDPRYRYFDFESQANRVGYQLLEEERHDAALFIFQLVTELYPESPNAWDSLGEGHWKSGQTGKAVEYYEKASELDPAGPIGDNARQMLEKIREEQEAASGDQAGAAALRRQPAVI